MWGQGVSGGSKRSRSGSTPPEEQQSFPHPANRLAMLLPPLAWWCPYLCLARRLGQQWKIRRCRPPLAVDLRSSMPRVALATDPASGGADGLGRPLDGFSGLIHCFAFFLFY